MAISVRVNVAPVISSVARTHVAGNMETTKYEYLQKYSIIYIYVRIVLVLKIYLKFISCYFKGMPLRNIFEAATDIVLNCNNCKKHC